MHDVRHLEEGESSHIGVVLVDQVVIEVDVGRLEMLLPDAEVLEVGQVLVVPGAGRKSPFAEPYVSVWCMRSDSGPSVGYGLNVLMSVLMSVLVSTLVEGAPVLFLHQRSAEAVARVIFVTYEWPLNT
eukprot:1190864-Prorocentrum_minimum.AAC.2